MGGSISSNPINVIPSVNIKYKDVEDNVAAGEGISLGFTTAAAFFGEDPPVAACLAGAGYLVDKSTDPPKSYNFSANSTNYTFAATQTKNYLQYGFPYKQMIFPATQQLLNGDATTEFQKCNWGSGTRQ